MPTAHPSFARIRVAAATIALAWRQPRRARSRWRSPATDADLDPVVVTATRSAERSFDLPASVDPIDAATIRDGQPMVNLSEIAGARARHLRREPAELRAGPADQLRGFGARATFGVRGVRLYQDGIPATMPDGQGQTGSFSLFSAERIEVLRGPFSTLYGNASGGVISVFTEDGTRRRRSSR